MISPALLNDLRPVLAQMIREAITVPVPMTMLPGTVQAVSSSGTVSVLPDSASSPIDVQTLVGRPATGARVMLLFSPPSGIFIIGYCGDQVEGTPIGCEFRRAALFGTTSAVVASIPWDTQQEASDNFGILPVAALSIPAGLDGIWYINGIANFASSVGANRSFAEVATSRYTDTFRSPFGNGENQGSAGGLFHLYGGDTFNLNVFQSTGAGVNINAARIMAYLVSP